MACKYCAYTGLQADGVTACPCKRNFAAEAQPMIIDQDFKLPEASDEKRRLLAGIYTRSLDDFAAELASVTISATGRFRWRGLLYPTLAELAEAIKEELKK